MPVSFARSSCLKAAALVFAFAATHATAEPLRIGYPTGMNGQIVVTMEKAKIAEKNDLQADYASFQYGPPMMEAFASGALDAIVTSLMPVTAYAAKAPGDVKIVAMLGQSSHSLMVDKDGPVKSPADLAGRKLGVSFGSDSHLDTLVWLKEQGLADKLELINVAPSELAAALGNRSVDAIIIRQPQVERLTETSGAVALKTWPFRFVSVMRADFIEKHPETVKRYVASLRDAMFYVAQNKQQAAEWFGKTLRMDPETVIKVSNDDPNYNVTDISQIDVAVDDHARELVREWARQAYELKMIRRPLEPNGLF